jgi:hypothetical protein
MSAGPAEKFVAIVADARPIVASVNETMAMLKIGRATLYQLLNSGELKSYLQGSARKILCSSIEDYVQLRLEEEAKRRRRR